MHEIDMLMHFFMVPGSENHHFDQFLRFYLDFLLEKSEKSKNRKKSKKSQNHPHIKNHSKKLLAMSKIDFSIFKKIIIIDFSFFHKKS